MKKIIFSIQILFVTLMLSSCLHDDNVVFDEPAAQRVEKAVEADKTLLESATNGWLLRLWTEENYEGGGYTYLMKFKDGKVTVASDIDYPQNTSSSSYDVIKDMGPVLTVNTYNKIFHMLSSPSQMDDDGKGQDYEFLIQRTTNDSIFLEGKKFHNKMVMTRLKDNVNWKDYITAMQKVAENVKQKYNCIIGKDTTNVEVSAERRFSISSKSGEKSVPFCYTENGIELQSPVMIAGKQVQHFTYSIDNLSFTSTDAGATDIVLNADFMRYADYIGTYKFEYENASIQVKLVASGDGKTYKLEGLSPDFHLTFTYKPEDGSLTWSPELIYTAPNGHEFWMCSMALADGGDYYKIDMLGYNITKDTAQPGTYLTFTPTYGYFFNTDSFVIIEYDGNHEVGKSTTLKVNGSAEIPYIKGMKKIQ